MILRRIWQTKDAVFGVLFVEYRPLLLTLEDPWNDNKPNESCIPQGDYICKRIISLKFGETFEVTHVLGRSHILFHAGNTSEDTHGCILLGRQWGMINGVAGIKDSKLAFQDFMDVLTGNDYFRLIIQDAFNDPKAKDTVGMP